MKTYKVIVLYAHNDSNVMHYDVIADYFTVDGGVYMFYEKANGSMSTLLCTFPANITIIESIEVNEK